jgi:hypothetical protein
MAKVNRHERRRRAKVFEQHEVELDPAAEALLGEHIFPGDTATNIETGEVTAAPDLKVTITRELVTKARLLGWSGAELVAEAIRLAMPGASDIEVMGAIPPRSN